MTATLNGHVSHYVSACSPISGIEPWLSDFLGEVIFIPTGPQWYVISTDLCDIFVDKMFEYTC